MSGWPPDIHPRRVAFTGADLCLNAERDIWLRAAEHPELAPHVGEELIVGDGTSVLGADNKAAVTILMDLLGALSREAPPHGDIVVAFVPDEEIGLRGSKALDLARFPVDFAYTIDSCEVGEFVFETFNAAQVTIDIKGVTAHPISAKGVLVNPVLVAADLIGRFDRLDTPEHTEGREGYCYVTAINSNAAAASVKMSLRDFDPAGLARRKTMVMAAVAATQAAHPRAEVTCAIEDSYTNIADSLGNDRSCLDLLEARLCRAWHRAADRAAARRHGRLGAVAARHSDAQLFHRRPEFPFTVRMPAGAVPTARLSPHRAAVRARRRALSAARRVTSYRQSGRTVPRVSYARGMINSPMPKAMAV